MVGKDATTIGPGDDAIKNAAHPSDDCAVGRDAVVRSAQFPVAVLLLLLPQIFV